MTPPSLPLVEGVPHEAKVEEIAIGDIAFDNTEFRFRLDPKVRDLVEDIRKNGQLFPVVLRPIGETGTWQIVCGFRRCTAIRMLGWTWVKAFVLRDLDDDAAYKLSFLENERRRTLTPLDKAHAVCQLKFKGKTDEEIMAIYGMSRRSLERCAYLSNIPDILKDAVHQGRILISHCLILMHLQHDLSGALDLSKWIGKIEDEQLTKRELEKALASAFKIKNRSKGRVLFRPNGGFQIRYLTFDPDTTSPEAKEIMRQQLAEAMKALE